MTHSEPAVALFDFDRTIVRSDFFKAFNRMLLREHWCRAAATVAAAPVLGLLWIPAATRWLAASGFLWIGTVGLSRAEFARRVSTYVDRRLPTDGAVPAVAHQQALEAIASHRRAGDRVVIVTAAAVDLVAETCVRLGFPDIEIVGSTLRPWAGGIVGDEHCYGRDKVRMLMSRGLPPPWTYVYTDSADDLPMLERGQHRYLVNPSLACWWRVTRRLGPGACSVLLWR